VTGQHLAYSSTTAFYVRHLLPDDVSKTYLSWLHDPEVTRYLAVHHSPPANLDALRDWVESFDQKNKFIWGIFEATTQEHVGNATIYSVDRRNSRAHLGYMIGNREFWGRKVLLQCLPPIFDFAFDQLLLHKLTAAVDVRNISSVISLKKLGFVKEGRFKEHIYEEGKYFSAVHYALFKEHWVSIRSHRS